MSLRYVIAAPSYDEQNGGAIFLHGLARALRHEGQAAFIRPMPPHRRLPLLRRVIRHLRALVERATPFRLMPGMEDALDTGIDPRDPDVVMVYPEITLGNPFGARNVVRWLLYPPGKRNPYRFGPDEMFFRVGPICDLPELTGGAPDLLMWQINPIYRDEGRPDRSGVCYILRKGAAKPRLPATEAPGAICIDGMSHDETAAVFNRCATFYSYDEATMYSQFAALCGCDSIVVPGMYDSREDWTGQHPIGRYGVAYGDSPDEIAHARATRALLRADLAAREAESLDTVRRFIDLTQARFGQDEGRRMAPRAVADPSCPAG